MHSWLTLRLTQDGTLGAASVRDTIDAVFQQRAYDRALIRTLLDRAWDALVDWFGALFRVVGRSPTAKQALLMTIITIVVIVVGRVVAAGVLGERMWRRVPGLPHGGDGGDPWAEAQRLAAKGNYTEAAHALYRALLEGIAGREQLRLHSSKTVGDYARDLRRRSSILFAPFREFARSYELVVYGLGTCDRARYDRLYTLATSMVESPS